MGLGTFFRRGLAEYPLTIVTEYEILVIDEIQEPLDKNFTCKSDLLIGSTE